MDHLLLSYFENYYQKANESERACGELIRYLLSAIDKYLNVEIRVAFYRSYFCMYIYMYIYMNYT